MRKVFRKALEFGRKLDATKLNEVNDLYSWMKEIVHETLETYGFDQSHFFGGQGIYTLEVTEENIGCGGFVDNKDVWTNHVKISVKDILDDVRTSTLLRRMFPNIITKGQVELMLRVVCWHEYYHTTQENRDDHLKHPDHWNLPHDARCWERHADEYALRKLEEYMSNR